MAVNLLWILRNDVKSSCITRKPTQEWVRTHGSYLPGSLHDLPETGPSENLLSLVITIAYVTLRKSLMNPYSLCSLRLILIGYFMSLSDLLEGLFSFEGNYYRTQVILNPGRLSMTIIHHRSQRSDHTVSTSKAFINIR